jgi:GR25 family glycosyltransferase involved in LPS biosynthesis
MSNWHILDEVSHAYVLSLASQDRRYYRFLGEISLVGLQPNDVERFIGIDGRVELSDTDDRYTRNNNNDHRIMDPVKLNACKKGQWATSIGHYMIIEDAMKHGYESVMIMEDDNTFGYLSTNDPLRQISIYPPVLNGCDTIFKNAMDELPDDWIMLYLNYAVWSRGSISDHYKAVPNKKHIIELIGSSCLLNCYIVHKRGYDAILKKLKVLNKGEIGPIEPADVLLGDLQRERYIKNGKSDIYGLFPTMITCQYPSEGNSVSQNKLMNSHYFAGGFNIH